MNETQPNDVLEFWLGPESERDAPSQTIVARWYQSSPAFDASLTAQFGACLERAGRGACDSWASSPRGRLALIIVLDQFTRNIHRGSARMFENDARALALTEQGLERGEDRQLCGAERQFLYMPFMHAESRQAQERSVALFEQLACDAPHLDSRSWAVRHHDIVQRFGCFPHRSHMLGRALTAEEHEFLKEPNSSF